MDRLETFLDSHVLRHLAARDRSSIVAGMLVPALLLADDIIFMSSYLAILQHLLDSLSRFSRANGLTVSGKKTKWMAGG